MKQKILAALVVTLLVLSLVPAFLSTPVYASSVTISPNKDTYIRSGYGSEDTNYGSSPYLEVGVGGTPEGRLRSLLEFPLSSLPEGSTVTSAYLQLYCFARSGSPVGDTLYAQRLLRLTWQEGGATWNKYYDGWGASWEVAGAAGTTYDYTTSGQSSATVPGTYGWINWDVTTQVQYAWSSYWHYVPFRVVAALEDFDLLEFYSSDYSDTALRPRLIVNYAPPTAPTVSTIGADNVTYDSATAYGKIIDMGSANVTVRGFKYGLTQSDTWDEHESGSFIAGEYSLNLTGLIPDETYYFRAYATNAYGTSYGSWESFATLTGIPIVTTDSVYVYEYCVGINAIMSGTITDEGNSTVVTRGFQYGLNPYSATGDIHEHGFWPTGGYNLTEFITSNATYWFRAYATNGEGTGFGIWKPFYSTGEPPSDCSGGGGANVTGSGTVGDPYVIWSDYGLQDMQNHLSSYWELGCTIDASATMGWNGGDGFVSVGTFASPFYGSFNGNNHTISGLYINRPSSDRQALFGAVSLSTIQNVYVLNATISGKAQVGVLIGRTLHSHPDPTIQYCVVSGSVSASTGNAMTGGLIGETDGGTIYRCASSATVNGYGFMGGLIGYCGSTSTTVTVRECFATGAVVGSADVGGLAGFHYYSAIYDCYARGSVYGSAYYEGGLTGEMYTASGSRSYSTGSVSSPYTYKGGLVGRLYLGSCISSSFWDTQTSGQGASACGTGKTTPEMKDQATFTAAGWDFTTIWGIDELINDGYPYLQWALTTPPEEATSYTLTLSSTSGGNVTDPGEGSFDYSYGQVVNLVATPDEGYRFALWVGDVSEVADSHSATTTVTVTNDFSITAIFVADDKYALYLTSTDGGDVTDPGEGLFSYDPSVVVNLEATAAGGYAFVQWTGDVDEILDDTDATTDVTMLDDYAVTANFVSSGNYLLMVSSTDAGDVIDPGEGVFEYAPASVVGLVAQPTPGCWFTEWAGDVGTIDDVYSAVTNITMSSNYSISAVFESVTGVEFALNITSSEGGSVTIPGEGVFLYAASSVVSLTALPDTDYNFIGWTGDVSTIADAGGATTTITVNGDYAITANFVPTETCSLMLSISSSEGGSVIEPGQDIFTFPCGSVIDLVAQSYEGWWFSEWTGDIGSIANPLSATTTISMYGDYSIVANFVEEEAPPLGAPNVTTLNATSITAISASLQGSLISLGNYTTAYVFFQYGLNTSYGTNTPEQMRSSTGNFSRSVNDLTFNTTYHFRAVARYGSYVYGEDGNFTTSAEGPVEPPGYEYQPCGDTYKYESYETGDNETAVIYGANWFYETFTPIEAFKISSVRLKIFKVGTPGALTVSIRNVDGTGKPTGIDLTSATSLDTGTSVGWFEISLPTYRLELKEYAIVVRAVAGDAGNYIGWQYDGGGGYADGAYGSSSDSGVSWTLDEDKDFMFETFGSTVLCIMDVKVFSGYLETDDWLITISYLNEFPPYYGVATASDYFNLQLIANGDLVASVGVPLWGNMPGSIYMSKALADTLEWGSTYTVRMRGTFDPYPTSTWTLTPPDWRGTDLTRLDAWVFEVASIMSTYYGQSLTVYSNNVNKLNDAGSALFAGGIPMLAALRGHLFVSPELYAPYTEASSAETSHWQEYFGPKIAADAATAGNVFGFSGIQFAQVAFFGLWFGASIVIAIVAGGAAFLVSIPFFMIGVMTDIVPKAGIAVVGAVFVLILVWYFWLRNT